MTMSSDMHDRPCATLERLSLYITVNSKHGRGVALHLPPTVKCQPYSAWTTSSLAVLSTTGISCKASRRQPTSPFWEGREAPRSSRTLAPSSRRPAWSSRSQGGSSRSGAAESSCRRAWSLDGTCCHHRRRHRRSPGASTCTSKSPSWRPTWPFLPSPSSTRGHSRRHRPSWGCSCFSWGGSRPSWVVGGTAESSPAEDGTAESSRAVGGTVESSHGVAWLSCTSWAW